MNEEARRRLDLLGFWERHGLAAAADHGGVSIRTLYRWQAAYRRSGTEGLVPGSRRPHRTRKREWPAAVLAEIRRLREAHPNLGKRKIHPLLRRFCAERGLRCPAVVTIGRLIADAGGLRAIPPRLDNRGRMKRPRPQKPRKPKGFRARRPGEVMALDTVIAIRDGVRRYLFGCLDLRSRFALALVTPGFSSKRASDFFDLALGLFPGRVDRVLSDNGSEFEGAFARLLKARGIGRYYTYPRSPKMNAHMERFNRTVQEEFLIHHEDLLWGDRDALALLNGKLAEWLLWYNGERPHDGLEGLTPIAAFVRDHPHLRTLHPPHPALVTEPASPPLPGLIPPLPHSMTNCQIHWARTHH